RMTINDRVLPHQNNLTVGLAHSYFLSHKLYTPTDQLAYEYLSKFFIQFLVVTQGLSTSLSRLRAPI
ncbi:MAG: hypothetical protein E7I32_08670, partial [Streptococcus sp.]|nr:hypothetical protein [Streptococcus sp.]